jgi:integrase/recombinase XerD
VSEALALRFGDVLPGGILHIRATKFGKSRLVPMHATVVEALGQYIELRRDLAHPDDHLFLGIRGEALVHSAVHYTFRCVLRHANIAPERPRPPRIHDLRHSFATRVLQQCGTDRRAVARQALALATYLGHSDIAHTYWYLQATPELMIDIAEAAELLVAGGAA